MCKTERRTHASAASLREQEKDGQQAAQAVLLDGVGHESYRAHARIIVTDN